ncbi:MAG: hypothetical protein FWG38_07615, partial [Defluviitaleaceae bacterium]|nr:hypothetical protein [Defluviitaleaceae bacterium]
SKDAAQALVSHEIFQSAKHTPFFIERLILQLSHINLSNRQVKIFRQALGMDVYRSPYHSHSHSHQDELGNQLDKLDSLFKQKVKRNNKDVRMSIGVLIIVIIAIAGFNRAPSTIRSSQSRFTPNFTAIPREAIDFQSQLNREMGDNTPASHILALDITPTWHAFQDDGEAAAALRQEWGGYVHQTITNWLYEETGREAVVLTQDFSFLQGPPWLFERVAFIFPDEAGEENEVIHWLHAYISFGQTLIGRDAPLMTIGVTILPVSPIDNHGKTPMHMHLSMPQAEFLSHAVRIGDARRARSREYFHNEITWWIQEETGRDAVLLTYTFSFLYNTPFIFDIPPEPVAFVFLDDDSVQGHWLYLHLDIISPEEPNE